MKLIKRLFFIIVFLLSIAAIGFSTLYGLMRYILKGESIDMNVDKFVEKVEAFMEKLENKLKI